VADCAPHCGWPGVQPAIASDMLTVEAEDASAVPDKVGEK